jgi:hypothetical protein
MFVKFCLKNYKQRILNILHLLKGEGSVKEVVQQFSVLTADGDEIYSQPHYKIKNWCL